MALVDDWLAFTDKLLVGSTQLLGRAVVPQSAEAAADPKIVALLLLSRTMSHVKGIRVLIRGGRILEARVLVRNCFENSFWVGRLVKDGQKFLSEVLEDEKKRRNMRGQTLFDNQVNLEGESGLNFRKWMRDNKDWTNSKTLDVKSMARNTSFRKAYVFYSELSTDAHPSTDTLSRYLVEPDQDGTPGIDFEPAVKMDEVIDTLDLNALAVIGVLVGVNQIVGAGVDFEALATEYQALQQQTKKALM
jgi:hypothetical protein